MTKTTIPSKRGMTARRHLLASSDIPTIKQDKEPRDKPVGSLWAADGGVFKMGANGERIWVEAPRDWEGGTE